DVVRLEDQPGHASDPTARVALPRYVRPERDSARVIHGQLHSFVLVDEFEAQRLRVELPRLVMVRYVHGAHQEFSNDGFRHLPSSIPRGTETPLTVGAPRRWNVSGRRPLCDDQTRRPIEPLVSNGPQACALHELPIFLGTVHAHEQGEQPVRGGEDYDTASGAEEITGE